MDFELDLPPVPNDLKNMLLISGYWTKESLENIQDSDFQAIEKFATEDLPALIESQEYQNYFGIYAKCYEKYKILPGYKSLLKRISVHLQNKNDNVGKSERISSKMSDDSSDVSESYQYIDKNKNLRHDKLDLHEESKHLKKDIINYISNYIKETCGNVGEENKNNIIRKLKDLKVEVKIDRNESMYGIVTCFLCSAQRKIHYMAKKANNKPRWLRGNYYTHFKAHLTEKMNKELPPNKKMKLISDFFKGPDDLVNVEVNQEKNSVEAIPIVFTAEKENRLSPSKRVVILENRLLTEGKDNRSEGSSHETEMNLKHKKSSTCSSTVSRTERLKRKLLEIPENQTFITNFYPYVEMIQKIIENDKKLQDIVLQNCKSIKIINDQQTEKGVSYLLDVLINAASRNQNVVANANRYDSNLKKFSTYLFIIGGRMLYEILYHNLNGAIPSITTIQREISKENNFEEGTPRISELSESLNKRKLPKIVWLSEDGTRINGRIQYSSKTNTNVGFVLPMNSNGFPNNKAFQATSVREIERQFRDEKSAHYAYVLVAQPLDVDSSSYCYCLYGTDNKFKSEDVIKRWRTTLSMAESHGIKVLGMSSDGDSRLLKAMKYVSHLSPGLSSHERNANWPWFHAIHDPEFVCVQDTVHIGTKLRTRLLKPSIVLPFGNYFISIDHIRYILQNVEKDKHLLIESDVNPDDKMNFRSVLKISDEKVLCLLKKEVPRSDATVLYLSIIRNVMDSFLEKSIKVEERLYKMWYSVFLLRIWRQWIIESKNYTLTNNFLSLNSYTCIELNAHSLVILIKKISTNEELTPDMFLPQLMSSQACEQMFRATRSMTSTFSTVVNYSILEILHRLHRIQFLEDSKNELQQNFQFPRNKTPAAINAKNEHLFHPMSDKEIEEVILRAQFDAVQVCHQLGVEDSKYMTLIMDIPPVNISELGVESDFEEESDNDYEKISGYNPSAQLSTSDTDPILDPDETEEFSEENDEELNKLLTIDGTLNLKDYSKENDPVDETKTGPFLKVILQNGKSKIIKKTSLCWLFSKGHIKLSSDRLDRFTKRYRKEKAEQSEEKFVAAELEAEIGSTPKPKKKKK